MPVDIQIEDSTYERRAELDAILEESFEGLYLRHARRTLMQIELVRTAALSGVPVGLAMIKKLDPRTGYIFYIAVAKSQRRRGIAGALLDDALRRLGGAGSQDVYSSVEDDNEPSMARFKSKGFGSVSFRDVSKTRGMIRALTMYREMLVVPGEILLHKSLS